MASESQCAIHAVFLDCDLALKPFHIFTSSRLLFLCLLFAFLSDFSTKENERRKLIQTAFSMQDFQQREKMGTATASSKPSATAQELCERRRRRRPHGRCKHFGLTVWTSLVQYIVWQMLGLFRPPANNNSRSCSYSLNNGTSRPDSRPKFAAPPHRPEPC